MCNRLWCRVNHNLLMCTRGRVMVLFPVRRPNGYAWCPVYIRNSTRRHHRRTVLFVCECVCVRLCEGVFRIDCVQYERRPCVFRACDTVHGNRHVFCCHSRTRSIIIYQYVIFIRFVGDGDVVVVVFECTCLGLYGGCAARLILMILFCVFRMRFFV